MAGGVLQLLAYGAQDMYLTHNPQITFFKTVFRRHTNFSFETFEHPFLDNPQFGSLDKLILPRNGDLCTHMTMRVIIESVTPNEGSQFAWVKRLGHAILDYVEIRIGGSVIDKHLGIWLDIWYELFRNNKHDRGYNEMIGNTPDMTELNGTPTPEKTLYIPLIFFFNRHYGLALPLIAIQYHLVEIRVLFNPKDNLFVSDCNFTNIDNLIIRESSILVDYVYLDLEERKRFAQSAHEYLIEHVQFEEFENVVSDTKRTKLFFNYPTKELIWLMVNGNYTTGQEFLCYTHEDDWSDEIVRCATQILSQSILLLKGPTRRVDQYGEICRPTGPYGAYGAYGPYGNITTPYGDEIECEVDPYGNIIIVIPGDPPPDEGRWEEFEPGTDGISSNGKIRVINQNEDKSLWINFDSLLVGTYSLTDKIGATVTLFPDESITITDVIPGIDIRDLSIPVSLITDTRVTSDTNVCVNQFGNYGIMIDGSVNPIVFSLLEINSQERFIKRESGFFNYLHPDMHHSNTPKDGVNVYSFAANPEQHQPTGTINLSRIENIILNLFFGDPTLRDNLPDLGFLNLDSLLYVFAFSYNILKISNGLAALTYTD